MPGRLGGRRRRRQHQHDTVMSPASGNDLQHADPSSDGWRHARSHKHGFRGFSPPPSGFRGGKLATAWAQTGSSCREGNSPLPDGGTPARPGDGELRRYPVGTPTPRSTDGDQAHLPRRQHPRVRRRHHGAEVAASIGPRLAEAAVVVTLDGAQLDLSRPLPGDGEFAVVTDTTDEGRAVIRHSSAHVLAQAVLDLHPGAAFAIGPPIEDGFYYDFDIGRGFHPEDLEAIEARMQEIIAEDQPFTREVVPTAEAKRLFADQPFKTEIIEGVDEDQGAGATEVSLYRNLDFVDLCRGPHVPSTGRIKAVKLLRSSGSYWRGDEQQPPAAAHLRHRLGDAAGDGRPPRPARAGTAPRPSQARTRARPVLVPARARSRVAPSGTRRAGCCARCGGLQPAPPRRSTASTSWSAPHLAKEQLWETSGHLDWYADNMYPALELDDDVRYRVKPMNCPFHVLIYRSSARSYRRSPDAAVGAGRRVPLRAVGHAPGAAPGARAHPGRQPHLLHQGPARLRAGAPSRLRARRCSPTSGSSGRGRPVDPGPGQVDG